MAALYAPHRVPHLISRPGEHDAPKAVRFAETEKDTQTQVEALALLVDLLLLQNKRPEATKEAKRADRLSPDNIQARLARAQVQFANDQISKGIASLELAFAVEPRADVAFQLRQCSLHPCEGGDLEIAVEVLTGIDLTDVIPAMRPAIAARIVRAERCLFRWSSRVRAQAPVTRSGMVMTRPSETHLMSHAGEDLSGRAFSP